MATGREARAVLRYTVVTIVLHRRYLGYASKSTKIGQRTWYCDILTILLVVNV